MRDYLYPALFVAGVLAVVWILFRREWKRQAVALLARRPNPTKAEYLAFMSRDVDADVAEWLWDELQVYFRPSLTPHSEDDLLKDILIDHDEPNDWLRDFCDLHGMRMKDVVQWPDGQAITIRNFARWLSDERRRLA